MQNTRTCAPSTPLNSTVHATALASAGSGAGANRNAAAWLNAMSSAISSWSRSAFSTTHKYMLLCRWMVRLIVKASSFGFGALADAAKASFFMRAAHWRNVTASGLPSPPLVTDAAHEALLSRNCTSSSVEGSFGLPSCASWERSVTGILLQAVQVVWAARGNHRRRYAVMRQALID